MLLLCCMAEYTYTIKVRLKRVTLHRNRGCTFCKKKQLHAKDTICAYTASSWCILIHTYIRTYIRTYIHMYCTYVPGWVLQGNSYNLQVRGKDDISIINELPQQVDKRWDILEAFWNEASGIATVNRNGFSLWCVCVCVCVCVWVCVSKGKKKMSE